MARSTKKWRYYKPKKKEVSICIRYLISISRQAEDDASFFDQGPQQVFAISCQTLLDH